MGWQLCGQNANTNLIVGSTPIGCQCSGPALTAHGSLNLPRKIQSQRISKWFGWMYIKFQVRGYWNGLDECLLGWGMCVCANVSQVGICSHFILFHICSHHYYFLSYLGHMKCNESCTKSSKFYSSHFDERVGWFFKVIMHPVDEKILIVIIII
jgi:hypothetical protein